MCLVMNLTEDKVARTLVWLMLPVGVALMGYGGYDILSIGYNVRGLWIAGGGLVLVLASYAALSDRRLRG
jgi:hypothetical protein